MHFLFNCEKYNVERENFVSHLNSTIFENLNAVEKLRYIMQEDNIKSTARYINTIFAIRHKTKYV